MARRWWSYNAYMTTTGPRVERSTDTREPIPSRRTEAAAIAELLRFYEARLADAKDSVDAIRAGKVVRNWKKGKDRG